MRAYLWRVLVALDQFVQACCNYGTLGVTISSRAETARRHGHRWGIILAAALNAIDKSHCRNAVQGDIDRAHAVIKELSE